MTKKEGAVIDEPFKAQLTAMGDSLVVSQAGQMARVHLHTNTPAEAVDLLESQGIVSQVKSDDMLIQQALSCFYPDQVALIIDSIADVPEDLLGQHVYCLPLHLLADGVSYQDKRSMSVSRMRRLAGKVCISQLNPEEIRQFLDPILQSYSQVLILTVSSGRLNELIGRVLQAVGFLLLIINNIEGEGTITGLAFSRARSDKLLMKKLQPGHIEEYGVVHANDEARAKAVAEAIQRKLGMAPRFICEISSIVALFAGEGAYAVAFIEK